MTKSILLVGVGGQGTILISKILTVGLTRMGYQVKMSEIHGMSQRGGSVITHVRVGDSVLLVHSTHARPVGTQVKLTVAPEDIQVMRKSDYSPDILKRHAARV